MIKNYFITAARNLINSKVYSMINIIGLAVGLTCTIVLSLYVIDELNYDSFYNNSDRIYRVFFDVSLNGKESVNGKVGAPVAGTLVSEFPEVENSTRIYGLGYQNLTYKDISFREWNIYGADSTYFDFVPLKFIEGGKQNALTKPNSIVFTESAAKKYFGEENPLGKIVKSKQNGSYLVTGVVENFPKNSHFSTEIFISMSTFTESENNDWLNQWYYTLIMLRENVDPIQFENKIQKIVYGDFSIQIESMLGESLDNLFQKGNRIRYGLQPLSDIYLYSGREYNIDVNSEYGQIKQGDITYVLIFGTVAIFILLLAVINYMNLSTARAEKRAKEVGIRKTLGSNKIRLVSQFLTESIITVLFSVIISLSLVEFVLPFFNFFAGKSLVIDYFNNIYAIPSIFIFTLIIGLLAGSYPAFYLTSVNTVNTLKGGRANRKSRLHTVLVVLQFFISVILIISTIVIRGQLDFMLNRSLGFEKEHLVTIYNPMALGNNIINYKTELMKNSNIKSVTNSTQMFRNSGIPSNGYLLEGSADKALMLGQMLKIDYDFLDTYKLKLAEGRFFSREFGTDSLCVIINEAAAKELKITDLANQRIIKIGLEEEEKIFNVIGIVKNFNYESLHQEVRPMVLELADSPKDFSMITIKLSSDNIVATMDYIKAEWNMFCESEKPFMRFVDENIQRLYNNEEKAGLVVSVFSFLALFIACLGLFGLVTFVTEQKVKEIGIRKSLGASVFEIVILLSKKFSALVIVANILAWPAAYYFMNRWLQDFAYRIDLSITTFIISGALALLIAIATVSYKAIKAALANPVESLRDE